MNIVTPLTEISEIDALLKAGADEFYLGYIPYSWLNKYFNYLPLNGRERMYADFSIHNENSMNLLTDAIDLKKIYIAINGHYYNDNGSEEIMDMVSFLYKLGYKNYIVADVCLIALIKSKFDDISIAVSGDAEIVNSKAIEFISKYDIKRIIFPRKTSIDEMKKIIEKTSNLNLEYEAFILNELCYYSSGMCNAYHCDELLRICRLPKKLVSRNNDVVSEENFSKRQSNLSSNTDKQVYSLGSSGCGICKIKTMEQVGVTHLKIVGRGKKLEYLIKDVNNIKQLVDHSKKSASSSEFEEYVKRSIYNNKCPKDCYYIERS